MRRSLSLPPESEIVTWPRPKATAVPVQHRKGYENRVKALEAVLKGSTLQSSADLYGVDREVLSSILGAAQTLDEKGKPFGFRACVPFMRTGPALPRSGEVPLAAAPHATAQLFRAVPPIAALVDGFKGELPTRNRNSRAFNRLMTEIRHELENRKLEHAFPLNTPDKGRRAILEWIKRGRARDLAQEIVTSTDEPVSVTRLDQVLRLQPFDRAEIDEHQTDVKWHGLVPTPKGLWTAVPLSGIFFIAAVDAVLPMCYAWSLVIGRGFNQHDFLGLQSKMLTPWKRRELLSPEMRYHESAWMPNGVETFDLVIRAASLAADNHASHRSKLVISNFTDYQVGIYNLGFPESPEGRPGIESFFDFMEENVFRKLAGGFRPAKAFDDEIERTSKLRPSDHPIDIEALEDLLDIEVSRFHALPRPSLQNRSVRQVVEQQLANGQWVTQSRLTQADAEDLVTRHLTANICGNELTHDPPHVNFLDGTYRNAAMDRQYSLVGNKYRASVPFSDASRMTLYDEKGDVYAVLRARPPWARPHTLEERERARQWLKRGIFTLDDEDGGDAVAGYHRCVRKLASKLQWAADLFVKAQSGTASQAAANDAPKKPALPPDTHKGFAPLGGHVGLMNQAPKK